MKRLKRFLIMPGKVASRHDNDMHWISSQKLIELYGVHPDECIIYKPLDKAQRATLRLHQLIELRPLQSGRYRDLITAFERGSTTVIQDIIRGEECLRESL